MFRKMLYVSLLISLIFGISACGRGNQKAASSTAFYYEEKEIGGNSSLSVPGSFRINSKNQLVVYDQMDGKSSRYVILSADGKPVGEIKAPFSGDGNLFALDKQDNLYVVARKPISKAEIDQKLYVINPQGQAIKTLNLEISAEIQGKKGARAGITDLAIDSDGNIYLANPAEGIKVLDKEGNQVKTINAEGYFFINIGSDNTLLAVNTRSGNAAIEKINAATGRTLWKLELDLRGKNYRDLKYSSADNSLYLLSSQGIEKIDAKGKFAGTVIDFSEYTIQASGNEIMGLNVDSAKNIYVITSSTPPGFEESKIPPAPGDVQYEIVKYNWRKGVKKEPKQQVITVAVRRTERYLETAVSRFHRNNPGYKIKLEIMQNGDDLDQVVRSMNTRLFAGRGPDILMTSWVLPYEKYISKNILVDLNEMMAKDKNFQPGQYYTNIFNAMKRNGHLYTIPVCFYFSVLTANQGILAEEGIRIDSRKWTWNDFMTIAKKVAKKDSQGIPIRSALPNINPSDLLDYFLIFGSYGKFVDMEKKSARFNSPEFIGLLETVKSFGDNSLTANGMKRGLADVMEAAYRGAVVFKPDVIQDYQSYAMAKSIFHGKVSVLNFPSDDGTGARMFTPDQVYAINQSSKYKEKAWEFIKILLSEDIQFNMGIGGFTVNKAAQRKKAQVATDKEFKGSAQMGDRTFEFQALTQEEIDFIDGLIQGLNQDFIFDDQIYGIIHDETGALFSGDKTASETAKLIQNRVNTYLKE